MTVRNQAEVREEFIERIGLISQNDGLPRIAGRVLGMFMFDGGVRSFGEITEKLQVSKASVSSATRILEDRSLIKRVGRSGQRQDYFQLVDNPFPEMLENIATGLKKSKAEVDESFAQIDPENHGAIARVGHYVKFYETLIAMAETAAIELAKDA
ncbi:MAG: DNA-binding transcriptional regulator GbsR (MarR family) [Loktanella salsilacus]|jgi:DNA-binding transcriptional regulator GbsR (MarR family)